MWGNKPMSKQIKLITLLTGIILLILSGCEDSRSLDIEFTQNQWVLVTADSLSPPYKSKTAGFRVISIQEHISGGFYLEYEWLMPNCSGIVFEQDSCSRFGRGESTLVHKGVTSNSTLFSFDDFYLSVDLTNGCCRILIPKHLPPNVNYRVQKYSTLDVYGEGGLYNRNLESFLE